MSKLLKEGNYDYDVLFKDVNHKSLIIYLLTEGYIDEDYFYYISYFYGESLTPSDREFLFSVKRGAQEDIGYKLYNIKVLLNRIKPFRFNTPSVLNIDLFDFILYNKISYEEKLNILLKQLINKSQSSLSFIDSYTDRGVQVSLFMNIIVQEWVGYWIHMTNSYSEEKINSLILYILKEATSYRLYLIEKESEKENSQLLSDYLNHHPQLLLLNEDRYLTKMKDALTRLKLKLKDISVQKDWEELHDYILTNEYYEINQNNLEYILTNKLSHKNVIADYITILASGEENFIKYIHNNIETYIKDVYLKLADRNETEENLLLLLNNPNIEHNIKSEIVKYTSITFLNISLIENKHLLFYTILYDKCFPSWNNILSYFEKTVLTSSSTDHLYEQLSIFLNKEGNMQEIIKSPLNEISEENKDTIDKFIDYLIKDKEIEDNISVELLTLLPIRKYENFAYSYLQPDKMNWLIENGYLELNLDNFRVLEMNYGNEILLLEQHSEKLLDIETEFQEEDSNFKFSHYELIDIIDSKIFTHDQKKEIIHNIPSLTIRSNKAICAKLLDYIIEGHNFYLPLDSTKALFESDNSQDKKIKFLNRFDFNTISNDLMIEILKNIGKPYFNITKRGKQPRIENNDYNYRLSENLLRKKLLYNNRIEYQRSGKSKIVFHSKFPK